MKSPDPQNPRNPRPRIGLAANRKVGHQALKLLQENGLAPAVLLVAKGKSADEWTNRMLEMVSPATPVICGNIFREPEGIRQLNELELDYVISVHFPYIVPQRVLALPKIGMLNLHPAFLPFNRGWHTPSWAIEEGTPYGATLHWMDEGVDTGDIAIQREIDVRESDTADSLYQRVLDLELQLFAEALPLIRENRVPRIPQQGDGTAHRKQELDDQRCLRLDDARTIRHTLRRLRALTTNSWDEAAYFEEGGQRYRVRVVIQPAEVTGEERRAA